MVYFALAINLFFVLKKFNMNIKSIICSYQGNEKDICKIRFEVFVDEQNVPEELEIDGLDDEAKHVLAYIDNEAIGTGRI